MQNQEFLEEDIQVVDYKEDSFKGADGSTVEYNYALVRLAGSVVKMTSKVNLQENLGETVTAHISVRAGQNMIPKLTIVDIK